MKPNSRDKSTIVMAGQEAGFSLALARSRSYMLLADIFLNGPAPAFRTLLTELEIPELVAGLSLDPEAAAARNYQMFGMDVFPYQSAFLEPNGMLGGAITGQVESFFRLTGYPTDILQSESPDHIGMELLLMAHLCEVEAAARQEGDSLSIARLCDLQRSFIDGFLMTWLPGLVLAIRSQEDPFYTALAELSLDLVCDHQSTLGENLLHEPSGLDLPTVQPILEDPKTGLKDIAAYLLAPAHCGFYQGRGDISRLAAKLSLPRGFGSRQQMLSNLLQTAADYDLLPDLLVALSLEINRWMHAYRQWQAEESPAGRYAAAWLERLETTVAVLKKVASSC